MKKYCDDHGVPCLDLLPILKTHKDEDIFYDHCHLTASGHRIIAGPISQFLKPLL